MSSLLTAPLTPATPGSLTLLDLERTLGVYFVGYMFAMVLYGFTFFQAYIYYSRFPHDAWALRCVVALLWSIDTAVAVLLSQTLYRYLVTLFPFTLGLEIATNPYCSQLTLSVLAIFIAQLFYAYSVWNATKNVFASGAVALFATAAFVLGSIMSSQLFANPLFADMTIGSHRAVAATAHGAAALAAIITYGALCFGTKGNVGTKGENIAPSPPKTAFDHLVAHAVSRSGCALILMVVCTGVFAGAPSRHYWIPFHVTATKLFVIGAITMLNSRPGAPIRGDGTGAAANGSRTIAGSGSGGTRGGAVSGIEFGVKPIVIEVDQETQHESETIKGRGYDADGSRSDFGSGKNGY